jgi:acyl carrier protein
VSPVPPEASLPSAEMVRALVLDELIEPLAALDLEPADVPDDFDLLHEGVIDSLGLLEMIAAVEERFGLEIDFEELSADELTIVGPFCRYVEQVARREATGETRAA